MTRQYTVKNSTRTRTPARNASKSRRRNKRTPSQKRSNRKLAISKTREAYGKSKGGISHNPRHIRFLLAVLFYENPKAYEETMLKLTMELPHEVTLNFIKHCYETKLDDYFQAALYKVFILLQEEAFGGGDNYDSSKTYGYLSSLLIERYQPSHMKYIENKI